MIPLPNPDTRTVASTRWGTPDYVPHTPSPQTPWRPTTADIDSHRGLAAEHSAFVVNRGVMYGLSLPASILAHRNATIRGPCPDSPPLPVPAPAPRPPMMLTTLQLQWMQEDLRVETPLPSPAPAYQSVAPSSYAPSIIMEEDNNNETHVSSPEPLPGFHPGAGWFVNHNEDWNAPMFQDLIPNGQVETVAAFYKYDFDTTSPELLLTRGRHCPVHSRPLHARADPYPRPALTKKQEFAFAPDQPFTRLIDHAIALEKDDTLKAEVIRYRALNTCIRSSALRIAEMRKDLFDLQRQRCDSAVALSEANAYNRLAPRVIFKDPPADTITAEEVREGHNVFDDPWADRPHIQYYACGWCGQGSHDTKSCRALNLCRYCNQFGHVNEDCRSCHKGCRVNKACRVPKDHTRYHLNTCRSDVRTA
jgi:hypothetical protein